MATTILDELLVGLGFDYNPEDLDQFKKDLERTTNIISGFIKVAVSAATAITGMVVASTLASDEQGKLAEEIGVTVEQIDALQFALRRSGGASEGMSNSLRQLSIRASEASRGVGSGVEAFGLLGISVLDANSKLKSSDKLLLEISDRFKGLSQSKQIELADKLGIRDSIRLLQQGRDGITSLVTEAKALGVTTAADAAISAEFQDSLTDLWQIIKQVSRTLTQIFAPILKDLVETFTNWWKLNKDLIEQNIPKYIDDVTTAFRLLTIAAGAFIATNIVMSLISLIKLFKGLGAAALLANAKILIIPALIFAALVAIGLVIEDIAVFLAGGNSLTGDFVKGFQDWIKELKESHKWVSDINDIIKDIIENYSKVSDIVDLINPIGTPASKISAAKGFVKSTTEFGTDVSTLVRNSSAYKTTVEKIEIFVEAASDPRATAEAIWNQFQQASQDLNSPVEQ